MYILFLFNKNCIDCQFVHLFIILEILRLFEADNMQIGVGAN